ncbi:MAG TPA: type III pantothenate kinase [Bacteroidia bacterium]|nr:type III pantothenate kinase [Bacteroidia bacterium]
MPIGSVTGAHEDVFESLKKKFKTTLFSATSPVPLKNLYQSALTLGSDRMAAAVGAYSFYPNSNVLTIDAGTCIKYNFVNANNEYLGGAISPGIPMRLKAMHDYTHALPEIEADTTYEKLTGQNTRESLLSGAIIGAALEADGMISSYKALYPALQVVITGGDAPYLCKQLKNRFFANQNILLYGLNTILNFNIEK